MQNKWTYGGLIVFLEVVLATLLYGNKLFSLRESLGLFAAINFVVAILSRAYAEYAEHAEYAELDDKEFALLLSKITSAFCMLAVIVWWSLLEPSAHVKPPMQNNTALRGSVKDVAIATG